jgi:hypothetical protein
MVRYPKINDDWIFREQFRTVSDVIENGGSITDVTIDNGGTFDGSNDEITYQNVFSDVQSIVITLQPTTTTEDIIDFDGGTHSIEASAGTLTATGFSSPTIYVDGAVSSTLTTAEHQIVVTTDTSFEANAISIGSVGASFYEGVIKEVRFYTSELSAKEVADINNEVTFQEIDDSRALLALPLRSTYNDGANDVTENIGSLGGTVNVDSGVTQLTPKGMNFPGTNNTLIIGTSASYPSGASARTVFLILETTEITGQTRFGGWGSSGSFGEFSFGVDTDTTTLELSRFGGDFTLSGSNLPNGGIHSVAYAYDGTDVKGYVDGIKSGSDSTQALDTNNVGAAQNPSIGSRSGGAVDEFIGDMYVAMIFDFELTDTQIKYLHNKYMRLLNV